MDAQKTGMLISELRKEKAITQKQLANTLHISDRTISKWERGAGFPDITLLEPLADALGLSVTSLLQGERICSSESDLTLRNAITILYRQMKEKSRKRVGSIIASIVLMAFFLGFCYIILDYTGAFLKDISLEIPVGIYTDGELTGKSSVTVTGSRNTINGNWFSGRFAILYIEKTCRDRVTTAIEWDDPVPGYVSISYHAFGGTWETGIQRNLYISEDMTRFALKLDDGIIIATDEYYVPLLMLENNYPLLY